MTVKVRDLSPAEREQLKEALAALNAPWIEGEPADDDERQLLRLEQLRKKYPAVAKMIGCE